MTINELLEAIKNTSDQDNEREIYAKVGKAYYLIKYAYKTDTDELGIVLVISAGIVEG